MIQVFVNGKPLDVTPSEIELNLINGATFSTVNLVSYTQQLTVPKTPANAVALGFIDVLDNANAVARYEYLDGTIIADGQVIMQGRCAVTGSTPGGYLLEFTGPSSPFLVEFGDKNLRELVGDVSSDDYTFRRSYDPTTVIYRQNPAGVYSDAINQLAPLNLTNLGEIAEVGVPGNYSMSRLLMYPTMRAMIKYIAAEYNIAAFGVDDIEPNPLLISGAAYTHVPEYIKYRSGRVNLNGTNEDVYNTLYDFNPGQIRTFFIDATAVTNTIVGLNTGTMVYNPGASCQMKVRCKGKVVMSCLDPTLGGGDFTVDNFNSGITFLGSLERNDGWVASNFRNRLNVPNSIEFETEPLEPVQTFSFDVQSESTVDFDLANQNNFKPYFFWRIKNNGGICRIVWNFVPDTDGDLYIDMELTDAIKYFHKYNVASSFMDCSVADFLNLACVVSRSICFITASSIEFKRIEDGVAYESIYQYIGLWLDQTTANYSYEVEGYARYNYLRIKASTLTRQDDITTNYEQGNQKRTDSQDLFPVELGRPYMRLVRTPFNTDAGSYNVPSTETIETTNFTGQSSENILIVNELDATGRTVLFENFGAYSPGQFFVGPLTNLRYNEYTPELYSQLSVALAKPLTVTIDAKLSMFQYIKLAQGMKDVIRFNRIFPDETDNGVYCWLLTKVESFNALTGIATLTFVRYGR